MGDTFGRLFRVTTFGESHGPAVGVVIEGCPPLVSLDFKEEQISVGAGGREIRVPVVTSAAIQKELDRRRPGQSRLTTPRNEADRCIILSGIFEGKTTGAPICALAWNSDSRSGDYDIFKTLDRPGHAGFTYREKYGIYDYRGGGRSSYRETWGRVAAGAIARKILRDEFGTEVVGYVQQIGSIKARIDPDKVTLRDVEAHETRCPDESAAPRMKALIEKAMKDGDSLGGIVGVTARKVPAGLGEPVFDKLDADLFKALKSIHATKSVEIGYGFEAANLMGSEHNDPFTFRAGKVQPATNKAGGVLGGISTGQNLHLRIAFKPTATIRKPQKTVNLKGKAAEFRGVGRHDPCVLPRAIATVEAMTSLVLLDHFLLNRAQCGS